MSVENMPGIENITTNTTMNTTSSELQTGIADLLGNAFSGSYEILGFVFLAGFALALYKARVSIDTGIVFMVPALFVFGKFGLLPGGSGTTYGLLLTVGGLFAAGLIRYFR